jgi:hypothetical protein
VPLEIVSKVILRHKNLSTTQRYLGKVSEAEAMKLIDRIYESGDETLASGTHSAPAVGAYDSGTAYRFHVRFPFNDFSMEPGRWRSARRSDDSERLADAEGLTISFAHPARFTAARADFSSCFLLLAFVSTDDYSTETRSVTRD